jgi:acyl-CoA thioester hydrolase
MARIRIDLPAAFPFTTEMVIYTQHINYGNHLDNAALIAMVSEARMRFFESLGFQEGDTEGAGIVVADAAIQYRSEAFRGEILRFEMAATEFTRVGCDLVYRVTSLSDSREVARGKTGIVFFDYTTRTPVAVPAAFIARATQ